MKHNYYAKKAKILILFIILVSLNIYSQCSETVSEFGNNTRINDYNVTGDVTLTLNTDNTITLDLASNFNTIDGPDVRVFLTNTNGISDAALPNTRISNLETIEFGFVSCSDCVPRINAAGAKTFTIDIPDAINIEDYDRLLFYCVEFNQFWDFGAFDTFDANSCAILSVEDETFNNLEIHPNPATTSIQISNINTTETEIRIFDFSGKKVFQKTTIGNENSIDVSNLKSGIYVLSLTEGNKRTSKKLVIQ